MIILDTSVWIEFFKKNEPYFKAVQSLLNENKVLTSEVIFSELLQGARSENERTILLDYWNNLPKFSTDGILIRAGLAASTHKWPSKGIGLIDSTIIQLAKETSSQIWSLDKKLNSVLKKEEIFRL